ncbi:restriction endonuclease PLD domain-containing protein [Priestia megaterium]|uniref:restriction endonuclease PLD domain-containing protein n=1 Tax=Priestia megaterium TaxID=1404 RepID=UPI00300A01A3
MYLWPNIYHDLIKIPYLQNRRKLRVLTGYASSSFVYHLLETYRDLQIDLIIGMAKKDGINIWDHNEYIRLANETERLQVYYYTGHPAIHTKALLWDDINLLGNKISFAGSANFTWNGFKDQQELMVNANPSEIETVMNIDNLINAADPNVNKKINLLYKRESEHRNKSTENTDDIDTAEIRKRIENKPYVDLSLKILNKNQIHEKSGLNWGQRPGREPNQAYLPVPMQVHRQNPGFFPEKEVEFTILTDDGENIICVMAQDNRKAIQSCRNNSILGKYFRTRLGVPLGQKVELNDLKKYGRDYIRLYKIDGYTYFSDYRQV